jgi:hypothetical protein
MHGFTSPKADAIVVLSGNFPTRAMEAAKLYHEGYAKEIWLTHPGTRSDPIKQFGVRYPSEDDCNYQVLRKQGVPAKSIHILETSILNTADELDVISAALQDTGSQSVIVVTDNHTRGGCTLFGRNSMRIAVMQSFAASATAPTIPLAGGKRRAAQRRCCMEFLA